MRIYFDTLNKNEPPGVVWEKNRIFFTAVRPIIVQPSEIMKVPLNLILKIEEGCILVLNTHPDLYSKAATLFPASLILDSSVQEKPLELAVQNNGRNPLHIMSGNMLAVVYLQSITIVDPKPFTAALKEPKKVSKTRPSKKNPDVEFEIK